MSMTLAFIGSEGNAHADRAVPGDRRPGLRHSGVPAVVGSRPLEKMVARHWQRPDPPPDRGLDALRPLAEAGLVVTVWWPASASSRRPAVNPVRAGRQQRQRRCRVPEFRL